MARPVPPSDHWDGQRFFNPGMNSDRGLADIWRWRRTSRPTPWPAARANRPYPAPPAPGGLSPGTMAVTFVGHATFLLTLPTGTILTDPFFSMRASPFGFAGPQRIRPPGLSLEALPPVDLILLSHNHYDHMDLPALRALWARHRAPLLTGLGNDGPLAARGVGGVTALDWWENAEPRPATRVTFVPAQHWSSRTLRDRRRTLWGGFVVEAAGMRVYFAGDSGACPWFGVIRERLGPPDLAILPIGAYEPRWFMGPQHMNPADAVEAHRAVGARRSVGMHFGTVRLTDEGIDEPLHALARARTAAGIDEQAFTTLDIGETRLFGP